MYEGLLIVLGPMFLGYLIKTKNTSFLLNINKIVMVLLFLILFVMGFKLGQLDNLAKQIPIIGISALTFAIVIQSCNIIALITYDKLSPAPVKYLRKVIPSRWKMLFDSMKLASMVLIGFVIGLIIKPWFILYFSASTYILIALIFFIGIQLRNNGISLKTVIFNKRGIHTGIIFSITSLLGGGISASILDLPITQGLAISSGFGWYSLSSVVINNAWGPIFSSIAFLNDLSREIVSLFIIPMLMNNYRSTAVGISGATALDCSLPIIQRSGGIEVVPFAISFGFITNILPPILLVFFSSIPI